MERKPSENHVRRILGALKKENRKFFSLEMLSEAVGLYPDALADDLLFFDPMVKMDPSLDMNRLTPALEAYVAALDEEKAKRPIAKRTLVTKNELAEYASVADFVYKKMTSAGGLVSPSLILSDHDLHLLQKLVAQEVAARKKAKRKKSS
jgi:hypothetical protein